MKRIEWLYYVMMAVIMMFMAIACSEKSDEEMPKDPSKPGIPVSDGDWQTVPVGGGTIEKGDITIEFPSGTFKKDTKIAVAKVKKGEICGDNEVSEFYQITAPITTYQPMTIKIKSDKQSDCISIVLHSLSYAPSYNETTYSNIVMETTYKNGEYTAIMPILANGNDTENISYSVGLAISPLVKAGTRAVKTGFAIRNGMVGDIEWRLYIDPSVDKDPDSWMVIDDKHHDAISKYIHESLQKILDMGFKLKEWGNSLRVVPFYYMSAPEKYGFFQQSCINDKFNYIAIGVEKMKNEDIEMPSQLKSTIIHELFHYFQSHYDPREEYDKSGGFNSKQIFNQSIINEMASVWVEQFMLGGDLNANYLLSDVFNDAFDAGGKLGFGQEISRWNKTVKYENYQEQGYTMGPWLQYLIKEIKDLNLKRKTHPVLDLYDVFKKEWDTGSFDAYNVIEKWLNSYDKVLLSTSTVDDYYLKLWQGQVVKGFNIQKLLKNDHHLIFKNNFPSKKEVDGRCYPYGCTVNKFSIMDYKDIKLDDKELVIKQEKPHVNTYVLIINLKNNQFNHIQRNGTIIAIGQNDSIRLRGKTLDKLRLEDGTFNHEFFLVTINKYNKMHDEKTMNPSHVTIELRDTLVAKPVATITPRELTFQTGGGTKSANVDGYDFKHIGFDTPPSWLTVKVNEKEKSIEFTAQPNLTGKERTDTVKCYVTNVDKPTEKDKIYLPVTVTQDGKLPSVSPSPLIFEAEGGMQTLNIKKQGFSYSKCIISNADKSWLSQKYNEGTYEVTAQPNTTGKERKTTIKCYVTNAQNGTDENTFYMDVEVTQKANDIPTVIPTSLTYEAEGGMQTLTIKVQGYKYCGCIIDDDAKSWLSKNYVSGGLYEVTAEPNTTNKERTTTIRCYVANEKNAPDDKRIYMEVQVAQLAGQEQTAKYQFAYGFVEMTIYTDIDGNNTMGRIDFEATDKFLTVSSNGKGLHFDINYKVNETNYSESVQCQFDIDDLSLLENKKSNVTNLSWKVDTNNKGGRSWAGVWAGGGDGWLVSQTQKIRFSTNSKIPEMDFEWGDDGTRSVNWYAYDNDISPSECTYDRSSTTISEEVGVVIDKGKGMQDGSNIWISLHFKEVAN